MVDPKIVVKDLNIDYGGAPALKNVTFSVLDREILWGDRSSEQREDLVFARPQPAE